PLVRRRLAAVEELFPMIKERAREKAGSLSGGQRRLVEFARGLMLDPALIILDEPSMGLDPRTRRAVFASIRTINEQGRTILLVADRLVALIGDGSLQPGDQLPTERELTGSFHVGRSSVREALRMLESQGVIRSVNGGVFVIADAAYPLNSSLRLLLTLDEQT